MIALIHIYCSTSLCAVYIKVSQSQCTGAYIQGFQPMSTKLGGHGLRQHRHETDRVKTYRVLSSCYKVNIKYSYMT